MTRFKPGTVVDHYRIEALLGVGAYAETYRATDARTGATVVLKMPDPGLFADPGLFNRYRREAEVARRLSHPSVQRAVDSGENRTEPYLALEYIDGGSLRQRVGRGVQVPIADAVDWGRQLAAGLEYLHANGIVHRDLKPENVLVDTQGRLKISDFGTARLDGARRLTWKHLSESLGTPDYMSPEQVQGERGDDRSDIYAWGVVMYELLTGTVPFGGDNALAVMAGHLQGTPKAPRRLRHDVPPALENIVLHAMRRLPENRYRTAGELLADLDHLETMDPATYDVAPERALGGMAATDSARRLWALVGLVAVGFIGLVALILVLSVVL